MPRHGCEPNGTAPPPKMKYLPVARLALSGYVATWQTTARIGLWGGFGFRLVLLCFRFVLFSISLFGDQTKNI